MNKDKLLPLIVAVTVLFAAGYVVFAALRGDGTPAPVVASPASVNSASAQEGEPAPVQAGPLTLPARPYAVGMSYYPSPLGLQISGGPLVADAIETRPLSPNRCERLYFDGQRGVCVYRVVANVSASVKIDVLDDTLSVIKTLDTEGVIPSRARISPNGKLAATSSFVSGHSYTDENMSTETLLIDLEQQLIIANLESFAVTRDGQPFRAPDFNYWGVTFANDNNRFYVTLRTNNQQYLVEGNLAGRTGRVIAENVECPSLSPDNTRIGYKKRINPTTWRLHVLDLESGKQTALAETESIDDQVLWLDNAHILYGKLDLQNAPEFDTWLVNADGSGAPRLFANGLASTAVIR
jgi:hypothetical protein